ncbi:glycosyltransferase family 4 protein [Nonomuraea sp. NPDC050556]|uniref:glycosyltransferase family 4 protein n=1 Tax=Nonomuraea sp. NPDC050556 TaxID=3364369 RepID=UPI0037956B01
MIIDTVVQFFPRGGSAQVIRYLSEQLTGRGHTSRILCGSLGQPGDFSHAPTFYAGMDIGPMDYNPAANAYARGYSGMDDQRAPFHPSYEDRGPTAPDRMFTAIPPHTIDHLVNAWARHLKSGRNDRSDVVHVHHLSHLQQAVAHAYPGVPRITTFHGTDLKLLDQAQAMTSLAREVCLSPAVLADACRNRLLARLLDAARLTDEQRERIGAIDWPHWAYADAWADSMRDHVRRAGRIVVVSGSDQVEVNRLLHVPREAITVIPNGVDTSRFMPKRLTADQRLAHLRRWLIDDPKGWLPGRQPGSIRYDSLAPMLTADGGLRPAILWVGRFQQVKRLDVLLEAFAATLKKADPQPVLLLWGGYPGEVEGDHPRTIARRLGIDQHVYFVGWRGHDELPDGLNCADLMAAPAVNESFGMVYIEAAACGVPSIATNTGGPASLITAHGPDADGWLVKPDDPHNLAVTLAAALADPAERLRRAINGVEKVRRGYAWSRVADQYQEVYEDERRSADSTR